MGAVNSLIENIKANPEDWDAGQDWFTNKKSGFQISIGRGKGSCRPMKPYVDLGWIARRKLWRAYDDWCGLAVWRTKK